MQRASRLQPDGYLAIPVDSCLGLVAKPGVSEPVAGYAMLTWHTHGKLPGVQKVGGLPVGASGLPVEASGLPVGAGRLPMEAGGLSVPNFTRSKAGGLLGVSQRVVGVQTIQAWCLNSLNR